MDSRIAPYREVHIDQENINSLSRHQRFNFIRILGYQHCVEVLAQQ